MSAKQWLRTWFIIIIIIPMIGIVNYVVDPMSTHDTNFLKLKKVVQTIRDEKVINVKKLSHIDNLVLGSSRTVSINSKKITDFLGGETYNFSVNSAMPEDYFGISLYLERLNLIPKNIIIGFDFYILNKKLSYDRRFVNNKELNFIDKNLNKGNLLADYLSIDVLKLSIRTIKGNYFEKNKINNNQREFQIQAGKYDFSKKIKDTSQNYFAGKYSYGQYDKFSNERIFYLKNIRKFAEKYNISVYTYLTPVHCLHLKKIQDHSVLSDTLKRFKSFMKTEFDYVDFMNDDIRNCKDTNFYDAVHTRNFITDLIIEELFNKQPARIRTIQRIN